MILCELEITLPFGIHLRPATELIRSIQNSNSTVSIVRSNTCIEIKNITDILKLGLKKESLVTFKVSGPDENNVIKKIKECIQG